MERIKLRKYTTLKTEDLLKEKAQEFLKSTSNGEQVSKKQEIIKDIMKELESDKTYRSTIAKKAGKSADKNGPNQR
jgi:hypothetical protein